MSMVLILSGASGSERSRRTHRFVVALLMFLACIPARADPLAIRAAWTKVPPELLPLLLEKKELFEREGASYALDMVNFAQGPAALRALAAGEIDLVSLSPPEFAVALENAGLDDLRIVADGYRDGVDGHYSTEYMVRDESPIRTIDDLKGKVTAVPAVGSMEQIGLTLMLSRYGLEEGPGYRRVELPPGLMGAMLEGRKIDLAALPAPFSYMVRDNGSPRTLFTLGDALGPTEGQVLVMRAPYVQENRAALEDFFTDYLRALRWFLDPDHRDEAVLIAAAFTRLPEPLLAEFFLSGGDYFRDPRGRPDLGALQASMDKLRAAGILAAPIDIESHADLGLVEAAARRLD